MRLFVAVPLPDATRASLERIVAPLRSSTPATGRWVPPQLWHVTVAFLGDVDATSVPRLAETWGQRARRVGPFPLRLAGAGAFPDPQRARVLWAGVDVDAETWARLRDDPTSATPHVTLARYRPRTDVRAHVTALSSTRSAAWRCTEVALVRSRPAAAPEDRYVRLAALPTES